LILGEIGWVKKALNCFGSGCGETLGIKKMLTQANVGKTTMNHQLFGAPQFLCDNPEFFVHAHPLVE
jgi:hypothetical protein